MEQKTRESYRTLFLNIGYECNNNCIFCYEGETDSKVSYPKISLEEICQTLAAAVLEYEMVVFLGAEPTLRPDFVDILRYAKDIGFKKISFSTNGRRFNDPDFARDVSASGVDCIVFSIAGGDAETHDSETRAPGSFNEMVGGLRNMVKFSGGPVISVSFTLNKGNYGTLEKAIDLLSEIGVDEVTLRNTYPLSHRTFGKEDLIMKMSDLSGYIIGVLEKRNFFANPPFRLFLQEFLPCVLPLEMRRHFIANRGEGNTYIRIAACSECAHSEMCSGILDTYADIYGTEEFHL
ncbi:MAG: radical SAM protein [Candidatus Colwellbacteria bacterium]|nr:radical SAM protein [Candidatus Colwellbacteria bacterium]